MFKMSRYVARARRSLKSTVRTASTQAAAAAAAATSVPATPSAEPPAIVGQAPNYAKTWSTSQRGRADAYTDVRFEQTALEFQPQPQSAMEMIAQEPVRMVHGRKAVCDGGKGPLGHPKVFINLDKPGPKPCGYCGLRFQQVPHTH